MTYSLLASTAPVVRLVVKLSGVVMDDLIGSDLRHVAGSYFVLPSLRGSYALTVSAFTAAGCEDGATRPMTVVVQ